MCNFKSHPINHVISLGSRWADAAESEMLILIIYISLCTYSGANSDRDLALTCTIS